MKLQNLFFSSCLVLGCLLSPAYADTTIVIVRHGEKPAQGLGQLSCKGLNRSLALASVLLSKYGTPMVIYAPNPSVKKIDKGISYAYLRPLATIEPLAIRVGLPVNLDWGLADVAQLAETLLARSDGVQLVAWEHHYAEKLASTLMASTGGNPQVVPSWNDADFDSVYVLRIGGRDKDRRVTFTRENEGLNDLPDSCPQ